MTANPEIGWTVWALGSIVRAAQCPVLNNTIWAAQLCTLWGAAHCTLVNNLPQHRKTRFELPAPDSSSHQTAIKPRAQT